ncbi:MAG: NAD(P)/FAD-dependent oxidoreductase [Minwuia sp.]|uniref:NAD(P)/FAD-dependent oxidoreductase n=1 Tax=Minwuia sp. TaxID=2493630 RepID=UPI003A8B9C28
MAEKAVIIGGGHAGGILAQQLARAGDAFEITLVGEEIWPPYERPPLSKQLLMGEIEVEKTFLRPADFYEKKDIALKLGVRVTAIDRAAKTVALSDGSTLPYDKLALCTGARLRRLPIPGADLKGVHYIRGIDDTQAIRAETKPSAKVVVIGGGYIGLEAAAALTRNGCAVKVIEMMDRVMARAVAEPLSRFYEDEHRKRGVEILLNTGVTAFEGDDRIEAVIDSNGVRHDCDLAIVGIGVIPDIELAEAAGLDTDGGIVVDARAQTSDPAIYAAGDCTSHPNAILGRQLKLESVQNAVDQARCIANEWQGKGADYAEVPWFWSDQFDLKLQMAGLPDASDEAIVRGEPSIDGFSIFYLRGGKVTGVNAVNQGSDYVRGRKWIGEGREVDPARLADTTIPIKEV